MKDKNGNEVYDNSKDVLVHTNEEIGDHVHCNNCNTNLLLEIGEEKCPCCSQEGTLAWVDEENPERYITDLENEGYKILIAKQLHEWEAVDNQGYAMECLHCGVYISAYEPEIWNATLEEKCPERMTSIK